MGQKIHPEGFRLGVRARARRSTFKSSWYSDRLRRALARISRSATTSRRS